MKIQDFRDSTSRYLFVIPDPWYGPVIPVDHGRQNNMPGHFISFSVCPPRSSNKGLFVDKAKMSSYGGTEPHALGSLSKVGWVSGAFVITKLDWDVFFGVRDGVGVGE